MIKVVLLDFDDTLCLTEKDCFLMENAIAKDMGFSPMTRQIHQQTWGKPLQDIITTRIPGINPQRFMQQIEEKMPEYIKEGKLDSVSKEILDVLHSLKKAEKQLAIVTSRSLVEVKHLLHETHPLTNLLDAFYHRDNLEYLKPDPRVFDKVIRDFSVQPQDCVYVGDSVSDAKAANGANIHFIGVMESGIREKSDFSDNTVDFFANKFTDILPYILSR